MDPELDFGGSSLSFSCEKFHNNIVYNRKNCRLGGHEPCCPMH